MTNGRPACQGGFTYAGVLLAVIATALALGGGAHLLGNTLRRDKETELMYAGDAIRRAIEGYHAKNTGGMFPFPKQLDWLLRDPNQPGLIRHLRRIYRDPMHDPDNVDSALAKGEWVLILDASDQIIGVHSNSTREPLRKDGFPKQYETFREAKRYADWKFIAAGAVPAVGRSATAPEVSKNFIPTPIAPAEAQAPAQPLSRGPAAAPPISPQGTAENAPAAPAVAVPAASADSGATTPSPTAPATTLRGAPPPSATPPAVEAPPVPPAATGAASAPTANPNLATQANSGTPPAPPTGATPAPQAPAAPAAPPQTAPPTEAVPAPLSSTPESFIIRAPKGF